MQHHAARYLAEGHGGGLGGLIGLWNAGAAAVLSGLIPAAVGFVVARDTRRPSFATLGILGAISSTVLLLILLVVAEDVMREAQRLPGVLAWLVNPITLVPSIIALAIVVRGAKLIPQASISSTKP